jgi:ferric-chelate reductase
LIYRNLGVFHGKKGVLSCKARLTALPGYATRITIENPPLKTWSPGQHVFLSIPSISPLQSHPFTIASSPYSPSRELTFVVRAHSGFSRRIYNRAMSLLPTSSNPSKEKTFTAILDGPYGCPPNFLQYDTLILIAGSTGSTFTIPILMHVLQSREASCVRRIQVVWIVKNGSNFDWFADEITRALEFAAKRGVELDVRGYVTCDPTYTTNFPVRNTNLPGNCCCTEKITDNEPGNDHTDGSEDTISTVSANSGDSMCKCNCALVSESPVEVISGRPDLRSILSRNLILARGETGVAVCGPAGLMAQTRSVVAALSDERGSEKGTGAYGIAMFGEGFGW